MPDNETVVRAKSCEEEREALTEANENLTQAKEAYNDALEDYTSAPWKVGATIAGGTVGTEAALGGILLAGEAAAGPIGWVVAGLTVLGGGGATIAATKNNFDEEKKADRQVGSAYEDYLEAMAEVEIAQRELEHCRADNSDQDGDGVPAKDDIDDDMPKGDADLPDFMPDGSDDLDIEDLDDYNPDTSVEDEIIVECQVCGYEGPIVDFGAANNPVCPYCGSEVEIGN